MVFLPSPPDRQKVWRAIHPYQEKDKNRTLAILIIGVNLEPGGLLAWLVVGLIAGFLASRVISGGGYGLIGDIIVGIIGAFFGGCLAGLVGLGTSYGLIGTIVIAFIGACILLAIFHAVTRGAPRRRAWRR